MFCIDFYRENNKKSSGLKPRGLDLCYLVCHLVDLYQVFSNYAPGGENRPFPVSHVLHRFI